MLTVMKDQIFSESGLLFSFRDSWKVIRYDAHRYYKIVSGQSIRGVDFACITDEDELLLIEVKNFYQHHNEGVIADVEDFAEEMKEKILDTLDLLKIIHTYHKRKWSYRLFIELIKKFPRLHFDWWYWTAMYDLHQIVGKYVFILVLNADADISLIHEKIMNLMKIEEVAIPAFQIVISSNHGLHGIKIVPDNA